LTHRQTDKPSHRQTNIRLYPQEPVPLLPIPNENEVPDQNSLDSEKEIHNVGNTDNNQNEVGEVEIERMQV